MADRPDGLSEVKTTIVLDEKVWRTFREYVLSRYGSVRKSSEGVEEALLTFTATNLLTGFSQRLGLDLKQYPSSREIKRRRPRVGLSAGKVVREMREAREKHISRFE